MKRKKKSARVRVKAEPLPHASPTQDVIELMIRDEKGAKIPFDYMKSSPLRVLMNIISVQLGLQSDQVGLTIEGVRINPDDNAEQLDLQDGDIIDMAFMSQAMHTQDDDGRIDGDKYEAGAMASATVAESEVAKQAAFWSHGYWDEPIEPCQKWPHGEKASYRRIYGELDRCRRLLWRLGRCDEVSDGIGWLS